MFAHARFSQRSFSLWKTININSIQRHQTGDRESAKSRSRNTTAKPDLGWLQPHACFSSTHTHTILAARKVNILYLLDCYSNTTASAVTPRCYKTSFNFTDYFLSYGHMWRACYEQFAPPWSSLVFLFSLTTNRSLHSALLSSSPS